jgi:methylmalonyl-CoA mutase N-terminal domain/subunit
MAMYVVTAQEQVVASDALTGTIQNDILKVTPPFSVAVTVHWEYCCI